MSKDINQALQTLLHHASANSQQALRDALHNQGFEVTQSTISRLLRKLGAVKVNNDKGEAIYTLPQGIAPANIIKPLKTLVLDIQHNETTIVITTNPGAATLIAHVLDMYRPVEILGTIAGDDTIFIAPISTHSIAHTVAILKDFLEL
jgi:transcriptional regulator of arginine metabolism